MKITTLIDAMIAARDRALHEDMYKGCCQYQTFRAALIRRDARQRAKIAKLEGLLEFERDREP